MSVEGTTNSPISAMIGFGSAAYNFYKQYSATPELVYAISKTEEETFRIYPEDYSLKLTASVSNQVLINISTDEYAGKKEFVFDNVAPGPRVWTIKGYVGEKSVSELGSLGVGARTVPVLATFMNATLSLRLTKRALLLQEAFYSRSLLRFKDRTKQVFPAVLIENLEFNPIAEVQNKISINITLREMNIGEASLSVSDTPEEGTTDGKGMTASNTAGTKAAKKSNGFFGLFNKDREESLLKAGYTNILDVMTGSKDAVSPEGYLRSADSE